MGFVGTHSIRQVIMDFACAHSINQLEISLALNQLDSFHFVPLNPLEIYSFTRQLKTIIRVREIEPRRRPQIAPHGDLKGK